MTTITSLQELIRQVHCLITGTKLRWWFRGHSNADWSLLPFVRRGYTREQEKHLSNEFYVRARTRHKDCPADTDYSGWLALMQHHGLPTRLLDWTRSLLIATFFATQQHQRHVAHPPSTDACLWALAPGPFNVDQGFENYLYPLNAGLLEELIRPALKGYDTSEKIVAAMAVENDPRMLMQQGAFTVHASDVPLAALPNHDAWLRQFLIPNAALPSFAHDLELMGFRLADIFPDLDHLALELKGIHRPATA